MIAVMIEHHDADLHALRGCGLLARLRNALRGSQIDGGEILNLFAGFAADDELLRHVLSKRRAAERDQCRCRQSQCHETKSHFSPPLPFAGQVCSRPACCVNSPWR